jgi:hypothetical protein
MEEQSKQSSEDESTRSTHVSTRYYIKKIDFSLFQNFIKSLHVDPKQTAAVVEISILWEEKFVTYVDWISCGRTPEIVG